MHIWTNFWKFHSYMHEFPFVHKIHKFYHGDDLMIMAMTDCWSFMIAYIIMSSLNTSWPLPMSRGVRTTECWSSCLSLRLCPLMEQSWVLMDEVRWGDEIYYTSCRCAFNSHTDLISGDEPRRKRVSVVGILVTQACWYISCSSFEVTSSWLMTTVVDAINLRKRAFLE